jgi:hypothetical protein
MCPEMLIPIRDFLESRKRKYKLFLIPGIFAIVALVLENVIKVKKIININDAFLNFVNVQISGIAILISFTIAIITILVTSGNANVEGLKREPAKSDCYNKIKAHRNSKERETITLFQVLLSGITYNVLTEAIFLVVLLFELFLQATIGPMAMKIIISIDVFLILHILYVLCQSVVDIYFVFWKR